jgi:hypothetical protein
MSQRCVVHDLLAVTKREITNQGYLRAPAVIGRTGVQTYTRGELGLDGDPKATVRLMRTADEVFRPETVASFENVPVTDGHPKEGVTARNWALVAKGEVRDIGKQDGELLGGHTIIKDGRMVEKVVKGKGALSCGYSFSLDLTPGEGFDGYQRDILGDHVAIVDVPRGGPICRIADETGKEINMSTTRKIAVDGLPRFEIDELAAEAIENHVKHLAADRDQVVKDFDEEVDKAKARLAAKDAELTTVKAAIAAKDAQIADLTTKLAKVTAVDVDALVAERQQVLDGAKKLAPSIELKGSSAEIRKAAIVAACGDELNKVVCAGIFGADGIEKASDAQIIGAFTTLLALPRQRELAAQDAAVARTLTGNDSALGGDGEVFGDDVASDAQADA